MPYIGRAPTGTGSVTEIDGDLKVTGQLTANDTLFKMILNGTDGSSTNASDNIIIEDGGTDGSGTDAGDDICIEKDTSNKVSGGNIVDLTGVTIDSTANVTGKIIQVVNVQDTDAGTSTNVITNDTSIPQISEGTEIMTLAITPTSASNYLLINVEVNGVDSGGSLDMNVALFQDSTADALGAAVEFIAGGTGTGILFSHYMVAGTTSETTFKVRGGPGASGTMTFTGQHSGASLFGVAMKSSITIWEISA